MNIEEVIICVVEMLEKRGVLYAIGPSFAGTLYRSEVQATSIVDLLTDDPQRSPLTLCRSIAKELKFEVAFSSKMGDPREECAEKEAATAFARQPNAKPALHIEFPCVLPWFSKALVRANHHRLNVRNHTVPVITVEDTVIGKLWILNRFGNSYCEEEDLLQILRGGVNINFSYLAGNLLRFQLGAVSRLDSFPEGIRRVAKSSERDCIDLTSPA